MAYREIDPPQIKPKAWMTYAGLVALAIVTVAVTVLALMTR